MADISIDPALLHHEDRQEMEYSPSIDRYRSKSTGWLTALSELRGENIRLKDRLSAAISGQVSPAFVEQAERFQQRFVEKDQVIDLLRHDINTLLYKLSGRELSGGDERQCVMLEKDIEQLIGEFQLLKSSFDGFVALDGPPGSRV